MAKKKVPPAFLKKKTGPVSSAKPSPTKAATGGKSMASPTAGGGLGGASNVRAKRSGGNQQAATSGGGIGARGGRRLPTQAYADHVPNHTFASSTMPRGGSKRHNPSTRPEEPDADDLTPNSSTSLSAAPGSVRQTGASAYETPDDRKRSGAYHMQAAVPTRTNELAAPQKKFPKGGIIKPSRKGLFTAKAKQAGMSVQAYAASVLKNPSSHDPQTVKQANFARNFGGAAKKGGSS
jgi:hypothetical protein